MSDKPPTQQNLKDRQLAIEFLNSPEGNVLIGRVIQHAVDPDYEISLDEEDIGALQFLQDNLFLEFKKKRENEERKKQGLAEIIDIRDVRRDLRD